MENTKNINTPASGTTACGCKPPMAPNPETDMTGMYVLANALKANGVEVIFGLVGIPVTEVAYICQMVGIRFISFRFDKNIISSLWNKLNFSIKKYEKKFIF